MQRAPRLGADRGRRRADRPLRSQPAAARFRWSRAASSSFPARRWRTSTKSRTNSTRISQRAHAVAEPLGHRLPRLGMSPKWTLRRNPGHAEEPLPHHDALHAEGRDARARHDVSHRDRAGQPRFFRARPTWSPKLRVGLALQPVITALFANSPFTDGELNGFLSARSEIWRAHRRAPAPACCRSPSSRAWGSSATSITRSTCRCISSSAATIYHDVAGASFRDLLAGRLAALPGERATISDWANHLSTIFPEVRLKRYLEMRGADVGPRRPHRRAVGADGRPLLRSPTRSPPRGDLMSGWSAEERQSLRDEAPRLGLGGARSRRASCATVARDALAHRARRPDAAGAARRRGPRRDRSISTRSTQSSPTAASPAQHWIARFKGAWGRRSIRPSQEAAI